jgi:FkbM family methyltransferase
MSILPTAAALTEVLPRFLRRHKLMTAWMRLTGESPIQLVRIRDDSYGYADMSDGFLRLIPIDGSYDEDFFILADRLLSQDGTFLDVGANYGLLSFGLAGRHGHKIDFHLFEPNTALTETIVRSQQRYPAMRCTVNAVAVSHCSGTLRFSLNEGQTGASHISTPDEAGGVLVPAITLDTYIAERGITRVDLVKLDVEGFELSACRGAEASLKSRAIRAVYFEYFEKYLVRVSEPGALIDYLDSLGFVSCFCRRHDLDKFGGATHTVVEGIPGHGLELLPVEGFTRPAMTDLLAIPRENLAPLHAGANRGRP